MASIKIKNIPDDLYQRSRPRPRPTIDPSTAS